MTIRTRSADDAKSADASKELVYYVGAMHPSKLTGRVAYSVYELPRKEAEYLRELGRGLTAAREDFGMGEKMEAIRALPPSQYEQAKEKVDNEFNQKFGPLQTKYDICIGLKSAGYLDTFGRRYELHDIIEKDHITPMSMTTLMRNLYMSRVSNVG